MIFDLFSPKIIPHIGNFDPKNPDKDLSGSLAVLAGHSEIPRPEYNYVWNKDGIRSIEFSTKPRIVALGCSVTLGQGLPVEQRWSDLLSKRLGEPIGNISYSGASIGKDVSSFFGMVHQYDYIPEILICNFANLERFYFINEYANGMRDWYLNRQKLNKARPPWQYENIIPIDMAYWANLDAIKTLEAFCKYSGIKLIWSTWSVTLNSKEEKYLLKNFKSYVTDPDRWLFPANFEVGPPAENVEGIHKNYEMIGWDTIRCHEDYKEMYPDTFTYAYDYHKISGSWGSGSFWPHPGVHRNVHFSDFYYETLIKKGYL